MNVYPAIESRNVKIFRPSDDNESVDLSESALTGVAGSGWKKTYLYNLMRIIVVIRVTESSSGHSRRKFPGTPPSGSESGKNFFVWFFFFLFFNYPSTSPLKNYRPTEKYTRKTRGSYCKSIGIFLSVHYGRAGLPGNRGDPARRFNISKWVLTS